MGRWGHHTSIACTFDPGHWPANVWHVDGQYVTGVNTITLQRSVMSSNTVNILFSEISSKAAFKFSLRCVIVKCREDSMLRWSVINASIVLTIDYRFGSIATKATVKFHRDMTTLVPKMWWSPTTHTPMFPWQPSNWCFFFIVIAMASVVDNYSNASISEAT